MSYFVILMKIVVLTGAGISAESGVSTFRDQNGLWENHSIEAVASPAGWRADPELVLSFYNARRSQLNTVEPNAAHKAIAALEAKHTVVVITQNVDNLHERGGSSKVIHLHGELTRVRSVANENLILDWSGDLNLGDLGPDGHQLRPHIVWFGEEVPMIDAAVQELQDADLILVIGSSMQVYPAAGLVSVAPAGVPVYYIDPNPSINYELSRRSSLEVIASKAAEAVPKLVQQWLQE